MSESHTHLESFWRHGEDKRSLSPQWLFCDQRSVFYSTNMQVFLRTIEILSLGLWLGADAFLSFVVAPGAFTILGNRNDAGLIVGF